MITRTRVQAYSEAGFSLVELITVTLLLGILGVAVISRFNSSSGFEILAARDGIIAIAMEAQQAALGRDNVTFEIDPSGSDWNFQVAVSGTTVTTYTLSGDEFTLETGGTGTTGDCSSGFDDPVTAAFQVFYDGKGNAFEFTNSASAPVTVDNGVRICLNDTVALSVCISPGGYAHSGDCDD